MRQKKSDKMANIFYKVGKKHSVTDSRGQENPKWNNAKKNKPRHSIAKLLKDKHKEKV